LIPRAPQGWNVSAAMVVLASATPNSAFIHAMIGASCRFGGHNDRRFDVPGVRSLRKPG